MRYALRFAAALLLPGLLLVARAEEESWVKRTFVSGPPEVYRESLEGSLRWIEMLGDRRLRQVGSVESIAVSPDGTWLVSGSRAGTLRMWESRTGREIRRLSGRRLSVAQIAVSGDGMRIFAAYRDGFDVWDATRGERLREVLIPGAGASNTVFAVSPDGTWAVFGRGGSASRRMALSIWDTGSGKCTRTLHGHDATLTTLAVSPDGKWIISGSLLARGTMHVWCSETGALLRKVGNDSVSDLAISPDGTWIVANPTGADDALQVWDAVSGKLTRRIRLPSARPMGPLALSPDGAWVVSGATDRTLRIMEIEKGRQLRKLACRTAYLRDVAISPDGNWIASGYMDGTIRLWDTASGRQLPLMPRLAAPLSCMAMSSDGDWIAAGSAAGWIKVWGPARGMPRTLIDHGETVLALAMDRDGRQLASGAEDGLRIWDVSSGKRLLKIPAQKLTREAGTRLARLLGDWAPIIMYARHRNFVHDVAIEGEGRWVASGHLDGTVVIRDPTTGEVRRTLGQPAEASFATVESSPDGTWIVSSYGHGSPPGLKIWEVATGRLRRTLTGHTDDISCTAICPTGKWLVSGSHDKTLRIWDAASGELLHTLSGHHDPVLSVAVSPDASWIASGSVSTLRVWDVSTGKELDRIQVDGGPVTGLAIHGNRICASLACATINVYEHQPRQLGADTPSRGPYDLGQ